MLFVAVGGSKFTDSLAVDVHLAIHEWLKINQSIKINRALRMKHTLTTKISFSFDCVSSSLDIYDVLLDATWHRQF